MTTLLKSKWGYLICGCILTGIVSFTVISFTNTKNHQQEIVETERARLYRVVETNQQAIKLISISMGRVELCVENNAEDHARFDKEIDLVKINAKGLRVEVSENSKQIGIIKSQKRYEN